MKCINCGEEIYEGVNSWYHADGRVYCQTTYAEPVAAKPAGAQPVDAEQQAREVAKEIAAAVRRKGF